MRKLIQIVTPILGILATFMILFGVVSCQENEKPTDEDKANGLTIEIAPESDTFVLGEKHINIRVSVKNNQDKGVRFNKAYGFFQTKCELLFYVKSPSGVDLERGTVLLRRPNLSESDFVEIRSHRSFDTSEDLRRWFQFNELGSYKVYVVYRNEDKGKEFGLNAWTGQLVSNTVTFNLVKK